MGIRERLTGFRERRIQLYFHIFVVHIYYPMRKIYNRRYAEVQSLATTTTTNLELGDDAANHGRKSVANIEWQWHDLPKLWPLMTWYRWASTGLMAYVVIKYTAPEILEWTIDRLGLSKPANCYLLGRFQLADEVERMSALLFALYHLVWRYFQLYRFNPMNISSIYFLILDDRDISQYYKLLAQQYKAIDPERARYGWPSLTRNLGIRGIANVPEQDMDEIEVQQVTPLMADSWGRERFMHEVMSYTVFRRNTRIYRLRPNRTPEASRNLRSYLIKINTIGVLIFTPIALAITGAILLQLLNDKRYLADYRGCNEELAQMDKRGELTDWSLHFIGHQQLAYLADWIENYFLWSESGVVVFFSPLLIMTINCDLVVYWQHLHAKIDALLLVLRKRQSQLVTTRDQFKNNHHISRLDRQPLLRRTRRSSGQFQLVQDQFEDDLEELVQDVQFEFQDFINQIRQGDHFIGELTSMLLTVWFTLFATFTYAQQTQLLPALKATLICVGLILTALYLSLLRLHQYCLRSYPKICSLMALDTSVHKSRFNNLLDYYVRKRTCYKFYRRVPITGIQYLTYVGWSLSCLFLVLNRR